MSGPHERRDRVDAGGRRRTGPHHLEVTLQQAAPIPLDVQFDVDPGDVLAIFGPSGAGKTTILRTIAGLTSVATARIRCGGHLWEDTAADLHVPTTARRVGLVPQDYALFPHLSARRQIEMALADRPRAERAGLARRWLASVHLDGLEDRRPSALSGGQQQRVALARALAREPDVLLLDEPFAGADAALRTHLHDELDTLRRALARPVVLVTHSMADVRRLATHLLVLDHGRQVARGPLAQVSADPALAPFVSGLDVGSVVETRVTEVDAAHALATCTFDGGEFIVPSSGLVQGQAARVHVPAREVILATARPVQLSLHNVLEGRVATVDDLDASRALVRLDVGPTALLAEVTRDAVARLALARGTTAYALVKSVALVAHASPI